MRVVCISLVLLVAAVSLVSSRKISSALAVRRVNSMAPLSDAVQENDEWFDDCRPDVLDFNTRQPSPWDSKQRDQCETLLCCLYQSDGLKEKAVLDYMEAHPKTGVSRSDFEKIYKDRVTLSDGGKCDNFKSTSNIGKPSSTSGSTFTFDKCSTIVLGTYDSPTGNYQWLATHLRMQGWEPWNYYRFGWSQAFAIRGFFKYATTVVFNVHGIWKNWGGEKVTSAPKATMRQRLNLKYCGCKDEPSYTCKEFKFIIEEWNKHRTKKGSDLTQDFQFLVIGKAGEDQSEQKKKGGLPIPELNNEAAVYKMEKEISTTCDKKNILGQSKPPTKIVTEKKFL